MIRQRGASIRRLVLAAALVSLAGVVSACAGRAQPLDAPPDGQAVLERACTTCHDLGGLEPFKGYWDEPEWRDMVVTMIEHGAEIDDEELEILVAYLTEQYGPQSD